MVIVGGRSVEERRDSKTTTAEEEASFAMAMSTERSRSLHNFSLPCLKWGGQRHLRCVKADGDGGGRALERRSPPTSFDFGGLTRKPPESERKRRSLLESDDGIEAVRKKLMLDLQTEMDKMKFAVMREGENDGIEPPPPPKMEDSPAEEARPWNLRTRRSACKEPSASGWKSQRFDEGFSPARGSMKPPASRNPISGGDQSGIKRPRAKFSVPLSKQEIEEDFIAMMGTRPPRKPKKRPRHVQKQMDTQFPGLWLSEITADMYKVNENPEAGKK